MRTAEEWAKDLPEWAQSSPPWVRWIEQIQADALESAAGAAERHQCPGRRYLECDCQTSIVNAIRALKGER